MIKVEKENPNQPKSPQEYIKSVVSYMDTEFKNIAITKDNIELVFNYFEQELSHYCRMFDYELITILRKLPESLILEMNIRGYYYTFVGVYFRNREIFITVNGTGEAWQESYRTNN